MNISIDDDKDYAVVRLTAVNPIQVFGDNKDFRPVCGLCNTRGVSGMFSLNVFSTKNGYETPPVCVCGKCLSEQLVTINVPISNLVGKVVSHAKAEPPKQITDKGVIGRLINAESNLLFGEEEAL